MPADPLKASLGGHGSNWRKDSAGLMMPLGGASSAKTLIELPKEVQEIAAVANTLARGHFDRELWPRLSMLTTIAGPKHQKTNMFVANITAGSMAEGGQASTNFLQGITEMLVPSAMPTAVGHRFPGGDGKVKVKGRDNGKVVEEHD